MIPSFISGFNRGVEPEERLMKSSTDHKRHSIWVRRGFQMALIACISGALAGCATFSSSSDDEADDSETAVENIEVDPVLIRAQEDEDGYDMEGVDAEELFEQAYFAFQSRQYDEAAEAYELIIEYFSDSRFFMPSLYNGGLSNEYIDQWDKAAEYFEILIEEFSGTEEAKNAKFRLANAWYELEEYGEVEEFLTELLLRDNLNHVDRIEAHNLRGRALLELGEWSDAENSFSNVLESNRRASPSDQLADDHRFIVLAHFGVGRSYHGRMTDIELFLPTERMREDLYRKADHHKRAQGAYLRALREYHPYWSVAAGYHVGRLYEDFYLDIFSAEIPEEFTDEQISQYFEELRKEIELLMDRALRVYERNLSFSQRVARGEEAERWVEETAIRLERMRALIDDPMVQQRAEELVVQEEDIEKLWDPAHYARIHVNDALEEALDNTDQSSPEDDEDGEGDEVAGF